MNLSDLSAITRMVFESLAQRIPHCYQNIFLHIARVTEDEFVPKQQLAKFEKSFKLHNGASVVAISNLQLTKSANGGFWWGSALSPWEVVEFPAINA
jgi:hypothetical protein